MKKTLRVVLLVAVILLSTSSVGAVSPYTTWAWGPGGYFFMTQDAYTPVDEIDLPISSAEDMFITPDGTIYIADTGNARIVKLKNFEVVASYGEGILAGPTGVFVDEEGILYVADGKSNTIVILDKNGNLLTQFGRPDEPLFGSSTEFLPRKIAVDKRKNLYIISEGCANGIVQMNTDGDFIGYFGANRSKMSLKMILQRMFLTKEQLAQFVKNQAPSPSNIAIDNQSLVYTVTPGATDYQAISKFTISGKNIFPAAPGSATFRDIHVSDSGLVLTVDATGSIYEYDALGMILFIFGAPDRGDQRLGTLRNPTAIERYGEYIYVLDKEKNAVVSYQTTAFAQTVHHGVRLYMDGFYAEAKPFFEDVIALNGSFIMSYRAIGDAYFKAGDYRNALANYRYGEDQRGYSQAFWELRNAILQKYLGGALIGLVGLWLAGSILTRLEKRHKWFDPARAWFKSLQKYKLVDDLVFMFRFIKQPVDSFYYIKKKFRGSLKFALLVYVWVLLVRILSLYLTGFVFNQHVPLSHIRVGNEIAITIILLVIWNAANYLVSTISDGEGRVRDVIIGSAYSLFPYVLFALPIALLSNVLTLNEVFIYTFSLDIMWFWMGLMLFIMVKEVHNYSFGETIKNILITIFTMALFLLAGYILYVLFSQMFDFVSAVLQEVGLRG